MSRYILCPDGSKESIYDDKGNYKKKYSKKGEREFDRCKLFIPDGYQEIEVPTKEVQTFLEFAKYWDGCEVKGVDKEKDKWGYIILLQNGNVGKVINRTNPNAKWDWWEIGGRYSNHFLHKNGDKVDIIQKKDIDIESMRETTSKESGNRWDEAMTLVGNTIKDLITWEECKLKFKNDIKKVRDFYHNQECVRLFKDGKNFIFSQLDEFNYSRETYINNCIKQSMVSYAILIDSNWLAQGTMGWWGISLDETNNWNDAFNKIYDEIPDDSWLTIIDCHI